MSLVDTSKLLVYKTNTKEFTIATEGFNNFVCVVLKLKA